MSLRDLNHISIERDISETSQKHLKKDVFCDAFKTSQKHPKKDVFSVTSLRRLKNISRKYFWFSKNMSQTFRVISVGLLPY